MTKVESLKFWAEVYSKTLGVSGFAGTCMNTAVEFGVMDMINQTKGMDDQSAAYMINDDANWMMEKMA